MSKEDNSPDRLPEINNAADYSAYEDLDAFQRLRILKHKIDTGESGNQQAYLCLLESAHRDSELPISEAEQTETLNVLRNQDPIMYDILYLMGNVNPTDEYQMKLRKMIILLVDEPQEIRHRYKETIGWFSLTGKVSPRSARYTKFLVERHPRGSQGFLILLLVAGVIYYFGKD